MPTEFIFDGAVRPSQTCSLGFEYLIQVLIFNSGINLITSPPLYVSSTSSLAQGRSLGLSHVTSSSVWRCPPMHLRGAEQKKKRVFLTSASIILFVPPIPLVASSAAPATAARRTVVAFESWCDGRPGERRLPARPPVTRAPLSVQTQPGVW